MNALYIASRIDHLSTLKKLARFKHFSNSLTEDTLLYISNDLVQYPWLNDRFQYSRVIVKPNLKMPTTKNLICNTKRIAKIVAFSQWLRRLIVSENIQFLFVYPGDLINILAYNASIGQQTKFIMYEDGLASYQYFCKQAPSRRNISLVCAYYFILKLFIKDLRSSQMYHTKYEKYFFANSRFIYYYYSYFIDCYDSTLLFAPIPSANCPDLINISSKHFQTVCLYLQPLYKLGLCSRCQLIDFYCYILSLFPQHFSRVILPHPSDDTDFVKNLSAEVGIAKLPTFQQDNTNFYRHEEKCIHTSIFSSIMCFNEPDKSSARLFTLSLFCKQFPDNYEFLSSIRIFLFNNGFCDYH